MDEPILKSAKCNLVLWNDHINEMSWVITSIKDICGYNDEISWDLMIHTHLFGCTILCSGSYYNMIKLHRRLKGMGLLTTISVHL
jgi:ATP-dependent Clp protease adapter protein ClpS